LGVSRERALTPGPQLNSKTSAFVEPLANTPAMTFAQRFPDLCPDLEDWLREAR
jgi:hypothetical protein